MAKRLMRDDLGTPHHLFLSSKATHEDCYRSAHGEDFFHNFLIPLVDLLRPDYAMSPAQRKRTSRRLYRKNYPAEERETFLRNFLIPLLDLLRPDYSITRKESASQSSVHPDTGHDTYTN